MDDTILVRILSSDAQPIDDRPKPEQKRLPLREAAYEIAARRAEPIVSVPDYSPELPAAGVSLAEAFRLFVIEHPEVTKDRENRIEASQFHARHYLAPPVWHKLQRFKKLRSAASIGRPRRRQSRGWTHNTWHDPVDSVTVGVIAGPDSQATINAMKNCVREFVLASVTHDFLARLLSGALNSSGVSEADLETLQQKDIPNAWWGRNVIVRLKEGELWERTEGKAGTDVRRWSEIRIRPGDAPALEANQSKSGTKRSTMPGRPSKMKWILIELERRIADERINKKGLRPQARELAAWHAEAHPDAAQPAVGTIENEIRKRYSSVRGKQADR